MQIVTKDLFEAAFFLAKGMRATKAFGGRQAVLLLFEGDESLGVLKSQYRQGQAEVNVKAFRKEMKQIRWFVQRFMDKCRFTNGEGLSVTAQGNTKLTSQQVFLETMSLDLQNPLSQETKNDVLRRDDPTSQNFRLPLLSQSLRA